MRPLLLVLIVGWLLSSTACMDSAVALPVVDTPPRVECLRQGTSQVSPLPANVATAARWLIACDAINIGDALSEDEFTFTMLRHMGRGVTLRNGWLRERDSGPAKELIDLGVIYPDDMSGLVLSAVWHQLNDVPFDLRARVQCWRDREREQMERYRAGIPDPPDPTWVPRADGIPPPPMTPRKLCYSKRPD